MYSHYLERLSYILHFWDEAEISYIMTGSSYECLNNDCKNDVFIIIQYPSSSLCSDNLYFYVLIKKKYINEVYANQLRAKILNARKIGAAMTIKNNADYYNDD